MKKILSVLLAAAMLVTALVVVTLPVSAAQGDWSAYTDRAQDYGERNPKSDIPGYEYVDGVGLVMKPGANVNATPYVTFQTTKQQDITAGIYLQVRVDEFSYDASDKWFAFSFWDSENVNYGKVGGNYGLGVETLIRINTGDSKAEDDKTTWPGSMRGLEWYNDTGLEKVERTKIEQTADDKALYEQNFDEEGRPIITIEVKWDDANEVCKVFVNKSPAPDAYNQAMTTFFTQEHDGMAYVAFSAQNNKKAGNAAFTILKYGTSAEDAEIPSGDDSEDPEEYKNEYAEIVPSDEVPEGAPAVILNGSTTNSMIMGKPTSVMGNEIIVNADDTINLKANSSSNQAFITMNVAEDYSYEVKDFPIILVITRNFCSCTYTDLDYDGVPDEVCTCKEKIHGIYPHAGDVTSDSPTYRVEAALTQEDADLDAAGNTYLAFLGDMSSLTDESMENYMSGRIHGLRLDFYNLKGSDPVRSSFDICEVSFFRTLDDAQAYYDAYIEALGGAIETDPVETDPVETDPVETDPVETDPVETDPVETDPVETDPVETDPVETDPVETDPVETDPVETDPVETDPVETDPVETDSVTTEPDEQTTEKAPGTSATEEKKGCGSVVGVGAIAIVAIAAAGLVSFKKKED